MTTDEGESVDGGDVADYVKCIRGEPGWSLCGSELPIFTWAFGDVEHALGAVRSGSRLVPCGLCLAEAMESLRADVGRTQRRMHDAGYKSAAAMLNGIVRGEKSTG